MLEERIQNTVTRTTAELLLDPTTSPAPTRYPTPPGYVVVLTPTPVPAIITSIPFDSTPEEACIPAIQDSMKEGMQEALGLGANSVDIVSVDGGVCGSRFRGRGRRLASSGSIAIEFEIESQSDGELGDLKKAVVEAATEGSIVTHVKAKAAEKGVLTPSLKNMKAKLDEKAIRSFDAKKTKQVPILQRPPTKRPTLYPTKYPTNNPTMPTKRPTQNTKLPKADLSKADPSKEGLPERSPTPKPANSLSDKISNVAKDSVAGLTPAEIAGIILSAICAVFGLLFAYKKHKSEQRRSILAEETAVLEKKHIMHQMENDKIEMEKKQMEYESEFSKKKLVEQQTDNVRLQNEQKRIELTKKFGRQGSVPVKLNTLEGKLSSATQ